MRPTQRETQAVAGDSPAMTPKRAIDEACREVALRAHSVGWQAYLLSQANVTSEDTPEREARAHLAALAAAWFNVERAFDALLARLDEAGLIGLREEEDDCNAEDAEGTEGSEEEEFTTESTESAEDEEAAEVAGEDGGARA